MKKIIALVLICMLTLSGVALAEKLTMGCSADFPPYESFDDATGEIVGLDVDIADAICKKLGYEGVEPVNMNFDSVITAVVTGKVDFGMSGMTVTEERKQNVDFTVPYQTANQAILLPIDSAITSVDDLMAGGCSVGVQQGTTGDLYTTEDLEVTGKGTVHRYNIYSDGVMALLAGKDDCMVLDDQVAIAFAAENSDKLTVLDTAYAVEEYAICLSKENELTEKFNAALSELIADGTVQSIIDKWIVD